MASECATLDVAALLRSMRLLGSSTLRGGFVACSALPGGGDERGCWAFFELSRALFFVCCGGGVRLFTSVH